MIRTEVAKTLGRGSVYRGLRVAVERCASVQPEGVQS